MEMSDIQSILRLFQGTPFPRTISTYATRGRQVCVMNIYETFQRFREANFVDCRINAYPSQPEFTSNKQPPDFVMADLDFSKFRTERMLIKVLDETVSNVSNDFPGTVPMVLFTGGGYHVYQPIDMPVLEEESFFRFFNNPSTEFIRFAAQRWTSGKNDACNNPSLRSCLLRVPGSINSKNLKKVEIVQEWNGRRPAANNLLQDFYIKSAEKKLACRSKQKKDYYPPTSHYFKHKTYAHYGRVPRYHADSTSAIEGIAWIDTLLSNGGTINCRKTLVDLVIAPYLVNIKQFDYNEAYNEIIKWLDKCGQKRRLDFNARMKVRYALKKSKQNGIRPMRLYTMQSSYSEVYHEVMSSE